VSAQITFHGGAGAVTGANFLLETDGAKILIDCGSYEQERTCDPESLKPFPYDAASIDALIVTHAHQDHIGRIPKLVREGFRGVIYSTPPTKDLAAVMLEDALTVMGEEAQRERCETMYDRGDIERALSLWRTHGYHERFTIGDVAVELLDAGHILGSAMVLLRRGVAGQVRSILFTGDLGNSPEPLLNDCETPEGADYLVMESVYGDRVHHDRAQRRGILKDALIDARRRGGTLLIPSFSLERTQVLLYELHALFEAREVEPLPVFLDAPLAIRVTEVFERYRDYFNSDIRAQIARGEDPFSFKKLAFTDSAAASRRIEEAPNPKVIIAGAGMSGGGRVRAHEKRFLPEVSTSVLFVGYQAPGTLGRRIMDGEKEVVIDGQRVEVRASVSSLTGYSGHKDRDALLEFVDQGASSLKKAFVVMGEPHASMYLAQRIRDFIGIDASVPKQGDRAEIDF
jgi:metallo-beta-lactamase family protein